MKLILAGEFHGAKFQKLMDTPYTDSPRDSRDFPFNPSQLNTYSQTTIQSDKDEVLASSEASFDFSPYLSKTYDNRRDRARRTYALNLEGMVQAILVAAHVESKDADTIKAIRCSQPTGIAITAKTPFKIGLTSIGKKLTLKKAKKDGCLYVSASRRTSSLFTQTQPALDYEFIRRIKGQRPEDSERNDCHTYVDNITPAAQQALDTFRRYIAQYRGKMKGPEKAQLFEDVARWALETLIPPYTPDETDQAEALALDDDDILERTPQEDKDVMAYRERIERACKKSIERQISHALSFSDPENSRCIAAALTNMSRLYGDAARKVIEQSKRPENLTSGVQSAFSKPVEIKDLTEEAYNKMLCASPSDEDMDFAQTQPEPISSETYTEDEDHPLETAAAVINQLCNNSDLPEFTAPPSLQNNWRFTWVEIYADRGFAVLPVYWLTDQGVCACKLGKNCPKPAKHPIGNKWGERATSDKVSLAKIWLKYPRANVGIAAGVKSGVVVMDFDGEPGRTLYEEWQSKGWIIETLEQRTQSDGIHALVKYFPGLKNNVSLAPGLDIRTDGGQIVVEPSSGTKGSYHWVEWKAPITEAPTELQAHLLALTQKTEATKPSASKTLTQSSSNVDRYCGTKAKGWKYNGGRIPLHSRNRRLFELASKMRGYWAMSESEILSELEDLRAHHCEDAFNPAHPVTDEELKNIARKASEYPAVMMNV